MASSNELISKAVMVRMLRLGLNQKTLAKKAGISTSSLNHYLANKIGWQVSVLDKLLAPLKWDSLADIFTAANDENNVISALAA